MTTQRDSDRRLELFLHEGPEVLPDRVVDGVREDIHRMQQRATFGPWRTSSMNKFAGFGVAAAAVVAAIVVSATALSSPSPRLGSGPALLARGTFVTNVGEVVELEATREGSSVAGRMTVSAEGRNGPYGFTVDFQCARETDDSLVMIGGVTTDSTGLEAPPEGTWAGIVFERGSPVGASTWGHGGRVADGSCLAFLDEQDKQERGTHLDTGDWTDPIEGTVELGPRGAFPSQSPSLIARGSFVEHDWGLVDFEAIGEGSSVAGRMTLAERGDGFGPITVDLGCTRATDDGLVMIGGYVTIGNQFFEPGTPAWIALQRGSPDRASVHLGSLVDVPATDTTDCLAYLGASLQHYRTEGYTIPLEVLDGGVEFGP